MTTAIVQAESSFQVTTTGLQVIGKPTYDEWVRQGRELWYAKQSIQWCIGDWLNYGESAYGEKYTQAIETTDYRPQTLMNYAYTARSIEPCERRENIAFSTHSEVASLDAYHRTVALDNAESGKWNRDDIRDYKRKIKGLPPIIQLDTGLQDAPVSVMQIGDKAYAVIQLPDDYPIALLANYVAKIPKPQRLEAVS